MININIKKSLSIKKICVLISLLLISTILFVSCSSGAKYATDSAYPPAMGNTSSEYDVAPEAPAASEEGYYGGLGEDSKSQYTSQNSKNKVDIIGQRKMIMDGNVSIETLQFDESVTAMDQLIDDFGGFAEVRTVRGKSPRSYSMRTANYVIRVPSESFELVLKNMSGIGTVLESNSKGTDITDQYYDTQTRIKTLKVQEETLLDILSKATKLEDVITLESRIAEVRYEIESLENNIKNYDRLVAFSRITIFIQEVDDRTETKPELKTLGERVSGSFKESLEDFRRGFEDFLVWLVGSWIGIVFYLIIAAILIIILKAKKRSNKKKAQALAEAAKQETKE